MTKLYAVVKPGYTFQGQGITHTAYLIDIAYFIQAPFHLLMYEHICGYSLGHDVAFFSSLEDAKVEFEKAVKTNRPYIYGSVVQQAIIELELDEGSITRCSNIHIVNDIRKGVRPSDRDNRFFVSQSVPVWKHREINAGDISANALSELNSQYQNGLSLSKQY